MSHIVLDTGTAHRCIWCSASWFTGWPYSGRSAIVVEWCWWHQCGCSHLIYKFQWWIWWIKWTSFEIQTLAVVHSRKDVSHWETGFSKYNEILAYLSFKSLWCIVIHTIKLSSLSEYRASNFFRVHSGSRLPALKILLLIFGFSFMLWQQCKVVYVQEGKHCSLSWQYVLASAEVVYPCVTQVKWCYMYIILLLIIQNSLLMFLSMKFSLILCSFNIISVNLLLFRIFLSLVSRILDTHTHPISVKVKFCVLLEFPFVKYWVASEKLQSPVCYETVFFEM